VDDDDDWVAAMPVGGDDGQRSVNLGKVNKRHLICRSRIQHSWKPMRLTVTPVACCDS
jgi:hypothetical protein